ncbi:MAG: TolC family protein, partial [Planctomycetota bacterium]
MGWRPCTSVLLLLLIGMIPGCATRGTICCQYCDRRPELRPEKELVVGARGDLEPDVTELNSAKLVGFQAVLPSKDSQYWVLRPEDVKCRAAAAAPLANLIQSEDHLTAFESSPRSAQAAALKSQWLAFREVDERNKAAARALEVFYLLAEVEAGRDLLLRGFQEIDGAIANSDRLKSEGIHIAADQNSYELRRQRIGLVGRWVESEAALRRLNGQLRQLTGLTVDDPLPIWPAADLRVTAEAIDVESAVAVGMELRADVELLRQLLRSVDDDTLAFVRSALGQIDGALGLPALIARRLRGRPARTRVQEEVYVRRHQVRELLQSRESLAADEIRDAALNVVATLDQVAVAKETLANRRGRVRSLEQKRGTAGGTTAFDISAARMQAIEAERDLIRQVIAWRIAQVKLKEAQGLLAFECGYGLPTRCCSGDVGPR